MVAFRRALSSILSRREGVVYASLFSHKENRVKESWPALRTAKGGLGMIPALAVNALQIRIIERGSTKRFVVYINSGLRGALCCADIYANGE